MLSIELDDIPLNWDANWPRDFNARQITAPTARPLLEEDGTATATTAAVATDPVGDGRRWRVQLGGERRWSDGSALGADDVVRAVRLIASRPGSFAASLLDLDGPPARAVGRDAVEIRFARPIGFARQVLALPQFSPRRVAPDVVLGAYAIAARHERVIVLEKQPEGPAGAPQTVEFRVLRDQRERFEAFRDGTLDVTASTSFSPADLAEWAGSPELHSRDLAIAGSLEFGRKAPGLFRHASQRRALAAALDRSALAHVAAGLVRPCATHGQLWGAGTAPAHVPETTRTGARPVERGPATGPAGRTDAIEIAYADFTPNGEIVAELAAQLSDRLGCAFRPLPLTFTDYVDAVLSRRFELLYTLTVGDLQHPSAWLPPARVHAPCEAGTLRDAELLELTRAAESAIDEARVDAAWAAVEDRWLTVMPRIPLVQVRANFLCRPAWTGLPLSPSGVIPFETLRPMERV